MKPKFFFLGLLTSLIGLSAFAQKSAQPQTAFRFAETFASAVINDELTVVLVEGASNEITVEGDAQGINAQVSDGCLYLSAKLGRSLAGTKVFVPANALSKIYLNGNAALTSSGVLQNARINIHLAAEAQVNVRSTGRVDVNTVDEIRFVKTAR